VLSADFITQGIDAEGSEWILIYGCPIVGKHDLFGGKVRGSLPPFVKKFMLDVFREPWSLQPVAQDVA
jgi:hypothetical protein